MNSGIFFGHVSHQRLGAVRHSFSYPMAMLVMDLDELPRLARLSAVFGLSWFRPLRFRAGDYLISKAPAALQRGKEESAEQAVQSLKQRALIKARELGAEGELNRVVFAGQVRHFGFYFSPVNFFFLCSGDEQRYLLAEVSNTPWNERHCYLVDVTEAHDKGQAVNDKVFHVSPFMSLDMRYRWQVDANNERFRLQIDNEREGGERLFRAGLQLRGQAFDKAGLKLFIKRFPILTAYILYGIYRQALSLFRKGVTFVAHPGPVEK
ncbi:DUF1365 domain-containing protein [Shewanella litorisediminis]|uniref:DUF1365 domain-containing protein n=1 Tax=Shewanella litorisediminis TaxID=1173586 RepID=A0ABX7G5F1_9GAMM|nr:DUF1365 domain-containing protein [Shewanella litorisediminis]MCL2917432.1 DUF1365 domain-containing protein [Shewanella litorisediminis]QRH02564.1 DUF1365 domain-containing protein [Shewanella litorisediminis]